MALLIQHLITRKHEHRVAQLTAGASFWLVCAAVATALTPYGSTRALFGGLLQHDSMRIFFACSAMPSTTLSKICSST